MVKIMAFLLAAFMALPAWAEAVIIYQGGGMERWQPQYSLRIKNREAELYRYSAAVSPDMVNAEDLLLQRRSLSEQELNTVLQTIEEAGFFALKPEDIPAQDEELAIKQGHYALLRIERDGETQEISVDNVVVPALNDSIAALQRLFPDYNLPMPDAACDTPEGIAPAEALLEKLTKPQGMKDAPAISTPPATEANDDDADEEVEEGQENSDSADPNPQVIPAPVEL